MVLKQFYTNRNGGAENNFLFLLTILGNTALHEHTLYAQHINPFLLAENPFCTEELLQYLPFSGKICVTM